MRWTGARDRRGARLAAWDVMERHGPRTRWGKHEQACCIGSRNNGLEGAAERRFLIFQTSARDALTLARHFAEQSEDRTRGIYFKIDEFFRDVFQRILAGLVYSMI